MSSFKGSYPVRIFTIKIQSNNFVKAQKLVQDSPASSHLERKSIERRRVRIEWKFSKNQYTFRKVLDMRMCKIVIKLPCWCTYSLFLEMWGVSAVLSPLKSEEKELFFWRGSRWIYRGSPYHWEMACLKSTENIPQQPLQYDQEKHCTSFCNLVPWKLSYL